MHQVRQCGYSIPQQLPRECTHFQRASNLQHIRLASCCQISDEGWCEVAKKFVLLKEIDISQGFQSKKSLEVIGQSCPLLKSLTFNGTSDQSLINCDDEALIIAKTMSGLCHLDIHGNPLTDVGLIAILDGCPLLKSLDITRCFNLEFSGNLWRRLHNQIKDLEFGLLNKKDLEIWEYLSESCFNIFDSNVNSYYEMVDSEDEDEDEHEDEDEGIDDDTNA
ncbi:F-box/LRR protein [Trifolium pratense]|uniref:F-box/LRR protein n=1 Tax=Trifolium pratense TaxID=57577 RepID=A0A2K3N9F4_TRIPR|nr:F-box/LRR protein [Trifolium pratense]